MIYLDHNANSPLRAEARAAMLAALEGAGNASSVHAAGRKARARVEAARDRVAALVGAPSSSLVFTSGGSEANALALRGAIAGSLAAAERITRIFVSAIEHESVRANALALEESIPGLKLTEIPVTADGVVDPAAFRLQFMQGRGRALVCVMLANNETGAIQPVAAIAQVLRLESKNSLLLVDAVQAAGRGAVDFATLDAEYLTLSAHKIGGPQGAGALVIRDGAPFAAMSAGAQENFRRGGTENVAAIAGFGAAAAVAGDAHVAALRARFEAGLRRLAPEAVIFAERAERLPNVSNFAIPGLSAETALIALDLDGIALSSGAACSSGKVRPSHVLAAMGVPEPLARSGLRLSLGWNNTEYDVDAVLAALERLLARKAALGAVAA
jgi:cysteine desulfurase